ncbi:nuclease-related domain-containing protein [Demequina globuliformis]|uniref:nuclease-related domain-containing protein n=1 Tax=Demequina globuliformis TaxID=676202 RepID=UPI000A859FF6|nr:nuclease-related domain-containing protein [Demequina globuliformis]
MAALHATRWKRYGHDRLYFTTADGDKAGYLDLATGTYEGVPAHLMTTAEESAGDWCAHNDVTPPGMPLRAVTPLQSASSPAETAPEDAAEVSLAPAAPQPEPPSHAVREWTDLSTNVPGQGVRLEAAAEWETAKGRSKIAAYANRYVFNNHTQERAWRVGAEGEEYIGARLNKLRDRGWHVLHSVPVGERGSDIDHVVIGPGGVFTVNSKKHPGKKIWVAQYQMRVGGQPVPYLRNSRHEAARAKRLLEAQLDFEVPMMGCVVVLTGTLVPEVTYKQQPDDVRVLDKWDVPRWFRKRPEVLGPARVQAVFDVARKSTTWV